MNVFRGGSLAVKYSDLIETNIEHNMEPEDLEVHQIMLAEGSLIMQTLGRQKMKVNSLHRQVVSKVAPTLIAAATSEDGLVESIEDKDLPASYFAVQWHPELLAVAGNPEAQALFSSFIKSCRATAIGRAVSSSMV
jgi:putative glutamine amidotransferase